MIEVTLIIMCAVFFSASVVKSTIPKIMLVSLKKRIFDPIDPRKVHTEAASRLGGVSFLPAIIIVSLLSFECMNRLGITGACMETSMDTFSKVSAEFASLMILYFVGFYDDIVSVRYRDKFIFQILTALWVILSGIYIQNFYIIDQLYVLPLWVAVPLTTLLIVFITNAINLIDGVNGLASMLSIMALATYGMLFVLVEDYINAVICFVAVGALLPFFYHNVFGVRERTKARIFMGDCGALVIGFLLSVMAVKLWNVTTSSGSLFTANLYHVLAYTMLFVPCMDVVRVVIHRAMDHQKLFLPDKNHIHHKFMKAGFTPQMSLLPIIGLQLFFVLFNIALSTQLNIVYILIIDCVIWVVLHLWMSSIIKKKVK